MSATKDKAEGMGNEAAGKVKQGVGKMTGDDRTKAEGVVQEKKGEGQQALSKAKEKVKGAADGL
jgi:uncharacterized protein YjbJ (UPF0337 family)